MQNIIVFIIGCITFGYVGWKIYKTLTKKPSAADKCGGCTGCALKVNMDCTTNPNMDKPEPMEYSTSRLSGRIKMLDKRIKTKRQKNKDKRIKTKESRNN